MTPGAGARPRGHGMGPRVKPGDDDRRVTIDDVRAAGHCVRGAREWFDRHGLDFRSFLREGIDEAEFLASGDGLAARIVDLKRFRQVSHG
jgi:hypothetical protein